MTRHAAPSAGTPRSRGALLKSCALIGAFGGGAAMAAVMLATPARAPAPPTRPLPLAAARPAPAPAKQGRVHPAPVALAALERAPVRPALRPMPAAAKAARVMSAAIPRPARPSSPLPLARMAAIEAGAASAFVTTAVAPLQAVADVAALAAEAPVVVASLAPAVSAAVAVAPAEEHVERQLPELKPQSAVAALAEAIDEAAVPLPAARPQRGLPPAPRRRGLPSENVLAYARPDAGMEEPEIERESPALASVGRGVAIYDISAATVYLPNGEKLEAHSGLGRLRDDPRQVHQKNRGPTPPHTYTLSMRESLFHGVQAIRLNPVGGQKAIHNRDGLLAHTYMLGKGGDSNGCVSFKDYKRFLAAFKRGDVKRLVVVASMRSSRLARPKSLLAGLFSSKG